MRSGSHRREWLGILALVVLVLVPMLLHGHHHGQDAATASAPCAVCVTSHQSVMHPAMPQLPSSPVLASQPVLPPLVARPVPVHRAAPAGRGPPPNAVVRS